MPLILCDRKTLGRCEPARGLFAKKEAAGDRQLADAVEMGIADGPGEALPSAQLQLDLGAVDLRAMERNRKADARVEEQIVVGDVSHAPLEERQVEPDAACDRFREPGFEEISS